MEILVRWLSIEMLLSLTGWQSDMRTPIDQPPDKLEDLTAEEMSLFYRSLLSFSSIADTAQREHEGID